ncbi:MAG: PEP-CTERM sorting domain-containing protein, partial [Verrucomicrobiota bacterium]|nr:PEP-CTERM sorting domain-containing protein [Verrucomicrobiota bacterium]
LQYGSATGAFGTFATFGVGTMIQAGGYFLVSAGNAGAVGAALPTPDFVGATSTNIGAINGKIQLVDGTGTTVDLVGYGTATTFEGTAAAPAGSNTTSLNRTAGIDTDNNNVDFTTGMPSPMASVPEPATYMLFGIGLLACAQRFRSRSKRK